MTLHEVVEEFAEHLSHTGKGGGRKIQIINEVHQGLRVMTGKKILAQTLQHLSAFNTQPSSYISITAKLFNQLVLVQLKTNLLFDYLANENKFREINEMAGELGGCLYISKDRKDEMTISYTYLNKANSCREEAETEIGGVLG